MNVSSVEAQDLLVHDYLAAVEFAAADLPPIHREELLADLREHIAVARSQHAPTESGVRTILDRLGHPLAIVDAARGFALWGPDPWSATGGWATAEDWPGLRGRAGTCGWQGGRGWPGTQAAPASVGAAPAAAPEWSFGTILQRYPVAVTLAVIAVLVTVALVFGFFVVARGAGMAPGVAS